MVYGLTSDFIDADGKLNGPDHCNQSSQLPSQMACNTLSITHLLLISYMNVMWLHVVEIDHALIVDG